MKYKHVFSEHTIAIGYRATPTEEWMEVRYGPSCCYDMHPRSVMIIPGTYKEIDEYE